MSEDANQRLVYDLATAAVREQRARRRWGIFFKFLFFAYLIGVTALFARPPQVDLSGGQRYAAVIPIHGAIAADGPNSANVVNALLRAAFEDEHSAGVILEINSPGGSAVESHRIYQEIRRLRDKFPDKQVVAVAGDMCASGGYFIAAAADSIYADRASIIGSIGVIFSSFGFVDTLQKVGAERRVQTTGDNKNLFDPFAPQTDDSRAVISALLFDIQQVFEDAVRDGRGERLAYDARIFNGTVFSGQDSADLGLIDGFNDTGGVARDIFGTDTIRYYQQQDWLQEVLDDIGGVVLRHAASSSSIQAIAPAAR